MNNVITDVVLLTVGRKVGDVMYPADCQIRLPTGQIPITKGNDATEVIGRAYNFKQVGKEIRCDVRLEVDPSPFNTLVSGIASGEDGVASSGDGSFKTFQNGDLKNVAAVKAHMDSRLTDNLKQEKSSNSPGVVKLKQELPRSDSMTTADEPQETITEPIDDGKPEIEEIIVLYTNESFQRLTPKEFGEMSVKAMESAMKRFLEEQKQ